MVDQTIQLYITYIEQCVSQEEDREREGGKDKREGQRRMRREGGWADNPYRNGTKTSGSHGSEGSRSAVFRHLKTIFCLRKNREIFIFIDNVDIDDSRTKQLLRGRSLSSLNL